MQLSSAGLNLIKQWEAFVPTPYNDGYGNRTIGYGHVIRPGERFDRLTEGQALQILAQDAAIAEDAVNRLVAVPLTQSQFDALVSLVFNWGEGNFAASSHLRRLNAGDYAGTAQRIGEHPVTSDGVYSRGLANRRAAEKALFLREGLPTGGPVAAPSEAPSGAEYFPEVLTTSPSSLLPLLAIAGGALVLLLWLDD